MTLLGIDGKKLVRKPIKGEKPGIGTRFYINGHMFKIVYVKHGKSGAYQRFTAELVAEAFSDE